MTNEEQEHNEEHGQKERRRVFSIHLDNMEEVDKIVRDTVSRGKDAASSVGETIRETIKSVRTARDSVVMVRINKESLAKLDELVDSKLNSSRSEAAAYMIAEGIKAKRDLFEKIAEQTEVIRDAREELRRLLDDDEAVPDQPSE